MFLKTKNIFKKIFLHSPKRTFFVIGGLITLTALPVTLFLSQHSQDFRQHASGGCTYRFVGTSFLCIANEGASSSTAPAVPDNMSVTDGNINYYGTNGPSEIPNVTNKPASNYVSPPPIPPSPVPPIQKPTIPIGWTWTYNATPCTATEYYCYLDTTTGRYAHGVPPSTSPTPSASNIASISYIACPAGKSITDRVRIVYSYTDVNGITCGNPKSSVYFQALSFSFTMPGPDSSCRGPVKKVIYYEGIPSNSIYTPTKIDAVGTSIQLSSDGIHKAVIIPEGTNSVTINVDAPASACAGTPAAPVDTSGKYCTTAQLNQGIVCLLQAAGTGCSCPSTWACDHLGRQNADGSQTIQCIPPQGRGISEGSSCSPAGAVCAPVVIGTTSIAANCRLSGSSYVCARAAAAPPPIDTARGSTGGNSGGSGNTGIAGNVTPVLTCDPVKNGVINTADYDLWLKEYTHQVNTTLTSCFVPGNATVNLLDFQVWKDISILKIKPAH